MGQKIKITNYCILDDKVSKLELSLESSQRESSELKVAKEKLSKEIASLKREHNEVCLELEERSLQLNKTSTQLANIESRCKVSEKISYYTCILILVVFTIKTDEAVKSD